MVSAAGTGVSVGGSSAGVMDVPMGVLHPTRNKRLIEIVANSMLIFGGTFCHSFLNAPGCPTVCVIRKCL